MTAEDLDDSEESDLSLLETLDHVLDHGLVIAGDVTISVANIDLIYLGLNVLLGSVEAIHDIIGKRDEGAQLPEAASDS